MDLAPFPPPPPSPLRARGFSEPEASRREGWGGGEV